MGNGPSPRTPFSDCKVTFTPSGIKLEASMGIPMPKLAYMPSSNSSAARRIIRSRIIAPADLGLSEEDDEAGLVTVRFSMRFSNESETTTRWM